MFVATATAVRAKLSIILLLVCRMRKIIIVSTAIINPYSTIINSIVLLLPVVSPVSAINAFLLILSCGALLSSNNCGHYHLSRFSIDL